MRQVLRGFDQNKHIDRFDETIEEFVEMIRVEGQKALSLAKLQVKAEVARDNEKLTGDLRAKLSEAQEKLGLFEKEIESRNEVVRKLSRQVNGFAQLAARRRPVLFISQLFNASSPLEERRGVLLEKWRLNAESKKNDREGSRVYMVMHRVKQSMHVFSSWRLYAATSAIVKDASGRIALVESEKKGKLEAVELEKENVKKELDEVKQALELEKEKRCQILQRIQLMFKVKFDDISSEMDGVISGGAPTTSLSLPRVNIVSVEDIIEPVKARKKKI